MDILKPDGNRINAQVDYTYDDLYRLVSEKRSNYGGGDAGVTYNYDYIYDAAGNRTGFRTKDQSGNQLTYTSYTYDAANKMTSPGTFGYDIKGNMTQDGTSGASYTWDALNRLTEWQKTGETTQEYLYNGYGMRVRKTVGQEVTNFLLAGRNILEEITGSTINAYVGPNLTISGITRSVSHTDGQSVRAISSENSTVVEAGIYNRDGNLEADYPTNSAPSMGYLRSTHLYTDSTGLQCFGDSYYNPLNASVISRYLGDNITVKPVPPVTEKPPSWWPYPELEPLPITEEPPPLWYSPGPSPVKPTPSIRVPATIGFIGFLLFGCAQRLGDGTLPLSPREQALQDCERQASEENDFRLKKCWGDFMSGLLRPKSLEKYLKCKDAANKDYYDELTECDKLYGNY